MSNIKTPLNLQALLDEYRCGKRGLPTYEELVEFDIQQAVLHARIAALTSSLMTVVHEGAQSAYLIHIKGLKNG